jgi:hypothetical protein
LCGLRFRQLRRKISAEIRQPCFEARRSRRVRGLVGTVLITTAGSKRQREEKADKGETEAFAHRLASPLRWGFQERMMGLEPTTFCMASRRSSQLSYIRK